MIEDLLFLDDNLCLFCKEEERKKFFLCENCLSKLDYVDNEFEILKYKARALYFYNSFIAHLISDYKFNRNTSLYRVFGQMLYEFLKEKNMDDFDYILTCPSSNSVLNLRGFDHIKMITDYFIDQIEPNYLENFRKISETKAQHKLNKEERSYNLKGAFSIDCDLTDKSILIIDDIITTGNTVKEIGKVLKEKNAREVKALAITSEHRLS